jgi:hypothetical protein
MKRWLPILALALAAPVSAQAPFDLTLGWNEARGQGDGGRDGGGAWFNLRRSFGDVHGVEFEYTRSAFDGAARNAFAVNWVQTNPEPLWRPFFLVGLGLSDGEEGSGAMASVGFGGRWELVPGRLDLRADLRYRHDAASTKGARNEGVLMIGIGVPLGSR